MPRYNAASLGLVAQLVEQRIENPRVGGSIPPQATKNQAKSPVNMTGLFAFLVCLFLLGIVSALFDCAHLSASDEMQW